MPRFWIGLALVVASLVSGISAKASFDAERQSAPPDVERPKGGRDPGPPNPEPEDTVFIAHTAAVEAAVLIEQERLAVEAAVAIAEEEARLEAQRQARAARPSSTPAPRSVSGPPPAAPASGDVWAALAQCESGMTNDLGDPFWGYFQFLPSTWRSLGYSGLPSDHPYETQRAAAQEPPSPIRVGSVAGVCPSARTPLKGVTYAGLQDSTGPQRRQDPLGLRSPIARRPRGLGSDQRVSRHSFGSGGSQEVRPRNVVAEPCADGRGMSEPFEVRSEQFGIVPVWLYDAEVPCDEETGSTRPLSRDAVALYGLLAGRYVTRDSGKAYPTHSQLGADLHASDRSVRRWLDELEAVEALRRTPGRPGRATVYDLSPRRVTKPVDNSGKIRTPVSGGSDTGVRAARTPVSDQPEEVLNQKQNRSRPRAPSEEVPGPKPILLEDGSRFYPGSGVVREHRAGEPIGEPRELPALSQSAPLPPQWRRTDEHQTAGPDGVSKARTALGRPKSKSGNE